MKRASVLNSLSNAVRTLAMVRATGLDKTGEQTPSSRRLAMARGAVAFEWVRVLYTIGNRKRAHIGPFFYLVRATGLEPARLRSGT